MKLASPATIHHCRWIWPDQGTASGDYVRFGMSAADFNQLVTINQYIRITAEDLDPGSGFRSPEAPAITNSDEFFQGKNAWGKACVIRVNRNHSEAILHVGG